MQFAQNIFIQYNSPALNRRFWVSVAKAIEQKTDQYK